MDMEYCTKPIHALQKLQKKERVGKGSERFAKAEQIKACKICVTGKYTYSGGQQRYALDQTSLKNYAACGGHNQTFPNDAFLKSAWEQTHQKVQCTPALKPTCSDVQNYA
ncbi:hypothetical protein BaRGS_00034662 [Batillaria attramentaria]|uniref:Uncharacterized protein n=1 Tax=Batillaria attramentaria TaxID=370345 RepID=A0ABD0JH00_9CAEN